jgi:hypothetical protein
VKLTLIILATVFALVVVGLYATGPQYKCESGEYMRHGRDWYGSGDQGQTHPRARTNAAERVWYALVGSDRAR